MDLIIRNPEDTLDAARLSSGGRLALAGGLSSSNSTVASLSAGASTLASVNVTGGSTVQAFSAGASTVATLQVSGGSTFGSTLIVSSGNVGIGTTGPAERLHVATDSSDAIVRIENNDATRRSCLQLSQGSTQRGVINLWGASFADAARQNNLELVNNVATGKVEVWTNSARRVTVDSSGYAGIGTATPSQSLDVNGAIQLGDAASAEAGVIRWTGAQFQGYDGTSWNSFASTGGGSLWSQNGSTIYYNLSNVAVGCTSASAPLTVGASSQFQFVSTRLTIGRNASIHLDSPYSTAGTLITFTHGASTSRIPSTANISMLYSAPFVGSVSTTGPSANKWRGLSIRPNFNGGGTIDVIALGIDYSGGANPGGDPGEAGMLIGDIQSSGSGSAWGVHFAIHTTADPSSQARERVALFEVTRDVPIASGSFSRGIELISNGTSSGGDGLYINGNWTNPIHVVTGAPRFSSGVILSGGVFTYYVNNASLEMGHLSSANSPFIDFHTSGNNIDYDSRILADGGNSSVGDGLLHYYAGGGHYFVGGDLYKNSSAYTNPDYVFEHWATGQISQHLDRPGAADYAGHRPLAEVKGFIGAEWHLPWIPRTPSGAFARGDALLASVEEAYLYLFDLDDRLRALE